MTNHNLKKIILKDNSQINDVVKSLNKHGLKICLVVDKNMNLLGTITDGDIRRGFLKGFKLNDKIIKILNRKFFSIQKGYHLKKDAYKIMKKKNIHCLPVLEKKKLVDIYFFENYSFEGTRIQNDFIILAGGFGKRLHPITKYVPKPMIIIKKKPILEHIITSARDEGFYKFTIIVHHLKNKIKNYFKDGSKFGVNIDYIEEKIPLGTAGGLSLLKNISKNIIITNADTLSNISYKDLLSYHVANKSKATIGIKVMSARENYGLVKLKGLNIVKFDEKPILHKFINCGVYALNSRLLSSLNFNENADMITFLEKIKNNKNKIYAFPLYEGWLDLGNKKNIKRFIE